MFRRRSRPDLGPVGAVPLFEGTSTHLRREVALHTDVVTVRPGRVVTRAGAPALELIVVVAGRVEVSTPDGTTVVAGPGTQVGGPQAQRGGRVPCTVVTLEPTIFVVVHGGAVRAAAMADEAVARRLAEPDPWSSPGRPAGTRGGRVAAPTAVPA